MNSNPLYRAPQADLSRRDTGAEIPREAFVQMASAGSWARITSILIFIFFFFTAIGALFGIFGAMQNIGPAAFITAAVYTAILTVLFLLGRAMSRYAKSAKRIKNGTLTEEKVIDCISATTSFTKLQGILLIALTVFIILIFALGAAAGISSRF